MTLKSFKAAEYFEGIRDVVMRLETAPITPGFDTAIHEPGIRGMEKRFTAKKSTGLLHIE